MLLMVTRSAGIVSIIISLILSFVGSEGEYDRINRLIWLIAGLLVLWFFAKSSWVDRFLNRLIEWALARWTDLDTRDYQSLLKLSGKYTVKELSVKDGDWLANKSLRECRLTQEGVIVLGIYRSGGGYVGAPKAETKIYPQDQIILYGRADALRELDRRRADTNGEAAHDRVVSEQKRHVAEQDVQEEEHQRKRQTQR